MEKETSPPPHTGTLPSMCCWGLVCIQSPSSPWKKNPRRSCGPFFFGKQQDLNPADLRDVYFKYDVIKM